LNTHVSPLLLLRQRDYLRLWACGAVLGTLRWLEVLAVGLYALEQTGSALVVALMLFARTLPLVLLGALMGALADRVDRRLLLAAGLTATLLTTGVLCAQALSGDLVLWQVALGAFINGCVWTMEHPVRRALISDVVGAAAMGSAISLDSATFNATRMVGPLAGGAVYAALGLPGAYALGVAAYSTALVLALGISPVTRRAPARGESFWSSLRQGLRYVASRDILAGVMLVTAIANLFGFSYAAMVPVIGERVLGLDAPGIGLLMSMEGLGASLAALTLAFVIRAGAYVRVFTAGAMLFLCMVFAFAASGALVLAMAALFLAGMGMAGFGAMQSTILLSSSESAFRSRVMGVLVVCIGAGPAGVLLVGWLAETMGAARALMLTSGCGLLCVLALCAFNRRLIGRFTLPEAG
jgi:MFS family permease